MRKPTVTDSQMLMLFELCLDAEDRCDERRRDAMARGDHENVALHVELENRYKVLRNKLFRAMKEDPTPSTLEELTQAVMSVGQALKETQQKKPDLPDTGNA
jgi:hypothetical protein